MASGGPVAMTVEDFQPDPASRPPSFRASPLLVLVSDIGLVLSQVTYLPNALLPLRLADGGLFQDITPTGLAFQLLLTFLSVSVIVPLIVYAGLAGGLFPIIIAAAILIPLQRVQGDVLVSIAPARSVLSPAERQRFKGEAWFFVNGVATSRSGMMLDLARLEYLFRRPVIGVLNRTAGPILDVAECVLQRDLFVSTRSVRQTYAEVKRSLLDDSLAKVVLMGHSQGGIIVSNVVDQLLSDVGRDVLDKLEIYTFASAANHQNNPLNAAGQPTIAHLEHYANGKDPVSRFGVLAFAPIPEQERRDANLPTLRSGDDATATAAAAAAAAPRKNGGRSDAGGGGQTDPPTKATGARFSGRLFLRPKASGHLLISHYIGKSSSILETRESRRYSRLRKYLGGNSPPANATATLPASSSSATSPSSPATMLPR